MLLVAYELRAEIAKGTLYGEPHLPKGILIAYCDFMSYHKNITLFNP